MIDLPNPVPGPEPEKTDLSKFVRKEPPRVYNKSVPQVKLSKPSDFLERIIDEHKARNPSSRAGRFTEDTKAKVKEMLDQYGAMLAKSLQGEDVSEELYLVNKRMKQVHDYGFLSGTEIARQVLLKWLADLFEQVAPEL
jgi:hypothetical protein